MIDILISLIALDNLIKHETVSLSKAPEDVNEPKDSVNTKEEENRIGIVIWHRSCKQRWNQNFQSKSSPMYNVGND